MSQKTVIILVGPTASGKTSLSIELAKRLDGEIVNGDSRQVYNFLDIGTAKPTATEKQGIPHWGFDVVDPDNWYSAGQYSREAREIIRDIQHRDKVAIVVGGSGLYVQALVDGFFDSDIRDDEIRKSLEIEENKYGLEVLHRRLQKLDPEYAEKTGINDRQRILRALEACIITGCSFTELHNSGRNQAEWTSLWIGLDWPREELYERINRRVDLMFDNGLLAEVKSLLDRGWRDKNALKSVGYTEIIDWLESPDKSEQGLEEAKELIRKNTRNYAKRQMTWFRAEKRINWLEVTGKNTNQLADEIMELFNI